MTAPGTTIEQAGGALTTLNADGTRRWLRPRPSAGRFLTRRRIVAYALICLFAVTPFIKLGEKPVILLDVVAREFTFFGKTFYPTDTLLLALLLVSVFVTIFLFTALFGRVWCGWACPQTVYMEFLYRPIERFFEGTPGRVKKGLLQGTGLGKFLKFVVFFAISLHLAHTFLSWFVGVDRLWAWSHRSPLDHPGGFLIVLAVTALMMFDFCYFREQVCIVACPYGRFQSALLDRSSLIVTYDPRRGEPRGKPGKGAHAKSDIALPVIAGLNSAAHASDAERGAGDCVDCHLCVTTCPTGIDIRNGLQMECINCAQCIDACDAVMTKLHRPRGLIRYSSQAAIEGEVAAPRRLFRPRVIIYPVVLGIVLTAFVVVLAHKGAADITVLRGVGRPFSVLDTGEVSNSVRIKVRNRADRDRSYAIEVANLEGARVVVEGNPLTLRPGAAATISAAVIAPAACFTRGAREVSLRVTDSDGYSKNTIFRLMGPGSAHAAPTEAPR